MTATDAPSMVLQGGWLVTLGVAAGVSPGGLWLIAIALERRLPRWSSEFVTVSIGDPAVAVALAIGSTYSMNAPQPWTSTTVVGAVSALWIVFGAVQLSFEIRNNFYTTQQGMSPSKLWHQFIVYPVLGSMMWIVVVALVVAPGHLPAKLLTVFFGGVWITCMVIDRRRPVLGHAPFIWRRLRPLDEPWPPGSTSLAAWRAVTGPARHGMSRM